MVGVWLGVLSSFYFNALQAPRSVFFLLGKAYGPQYHPSHPLTCTATPCEPPLSTLGRHSDSWPGCSAYVTGQSEPIRTGVRAYVDAVEDLPPPVSCLP